MSLPPIKVLVEADADGLDPGLNKAQAALSRLERTTDRIAKGLDAFSRRTATLGKNLSVVSGAMVAAGSGAFLLAKRAADAGDRIDNAARAAGVSTDYFQQMAYAVGQVADVSEDEFATALVKMTKTLGDARDGSANAIAAFERIGISQADIASGSVTTQRALDAMIGTLDRVTDPALASAIATDLLGRTGGRMGTLLAGSAGEVENLAQQATDLGIVMGGDAVAQSVIFNDKMENLTKSFHGVANTIAAEFLPVINNTLIPLLQDKVIPAMALVAQSIGDVIEWFGQLPAPVQEAAGAIAAAFAVGGPVLVGIAAVSGAISLLIAATGPIGLFITAATLLGAAWVAWGDTFKDAVGGAIDWVSGKFDAFIGKLQSIIEWAGKVSTAITDALNMGGPGLTQPGGGFEGQDFLRPNPSSGMTGAGGDTDLGGGGGADMFGVGVQSANGLVNGFAATMTERAPELAAIINAIPQQARDLLEVQSPSQVFARIGANIGEGMAQGIADSSALVNQAVATMSGGAAMSTEGMVSSILGSLSTLFNGSKKFAVAQALINAYQGATEALKLPFPANIAAFAQTLATGMSAVRGIRSAQPGSTGGGTSGAAAAAPQARPLQATLNLQGPFASALAGALAPLLDGLNKEAGDRGYNLMTRRT